MHRTTPALLIGALALAALGCEEETKKTVKPDTSAKKEPAVDPNLAKAMASAAPAQTDTSGPPPTGVFAPGAADREIKKGGAPQIKIGSEGSEPKVDLSKNGLKPGTKTTWNAQLGFRAGQRVPKLPIDVKLVFEAKKVKDEEATTGQPVVAKVTEAKLSAALANVPKDVLDLVSQLKGTQITFTVASNGAAKDFKSTLSKTASEGAGNLARALYEVLATVLLPYPDKPMGMGGFWMVTSRGEFSGVDAVAYRLVKVIGVEGDTVKLDVNTKRYSADNQIKLPGIPLGAQLVQFRALGTGLLTAKAGEGLPIGVKLQQQVGAQVSVPGQKQPGGFGTEATLDLVPPDAAGGDKSGVGKPAPPRPGGIKSVPAPPAPK